MSFYFFTDFQRLKTKVNNKYRLDIYAHLWNKNIHDLQDLVRNRLRKENKNIFMVFPSISIDIVFRKYNSKFNNLFQI